MAKITLKGNTINTIGNLPEIGSQAPNFNITGTDLSDIKLDDFKGKRVLLNIFPSLDTPTCATSVRRFNQEASNLDNTTVLCVSMDLPFAHNRFCVAEGLDNVLSASDYKNRSFSEDYGVRIMDGPLTGLLSRAVVIIDEAGKVVYTEQVPETGQEPDYDAAIAVLK